jgi:hypothetical protein
MWFAARDVAFENPVTDDMTQTMLVRMGILPPTGSAEPGTIAGDRRSDAPVPRSRSVARDDVRRMVGLLFIEVSAFHTFAWAEAVLADTDLVAGDGSAAELVRCIRPTRPRTSTICAPR